MPLPPRTPNTMSDAIALSSPSGRMSKRAKATASERLRISLFGKEGMSREDLHGGVTRQPSAKDKLLTQAQRLRDLAARGMSVRKFTREADKLEALAKEML